MDDIVIGLKARAYDIITTINQLQMQLTSVAQELDRLEKEKQIQTTAQVKEEN